ncbi:MAG: HNH endonuclease [Victivallaceae bacterium]|jgi:5-methylcytosine-specific restriction endonuclease McrA
MKWWMFGNSVYVEDEGYVASEIKVLILDRTEQKKKKVQRAIARVSQNNSVSSIKRESISDDVKTLVWQRDGGCCVICKRKEKLEFDHIIPFSKGGSNTARNLQLLCETCNRSKGGNIA